MKTLATLAVGLFLSGALHAAESFRFIKKIKLPSGQTAVVAEGDFEARSIGSFTVRLYEAATPQNETTFFIAGLVRPRDGAVEDLALADIDGDQQPEIIVTVRSVGTGGYLSVHAFAFKKPNLILRAFVKGLPPDADPVAAVRKFIRKGE